MGAEGVGVAVGHDHDVATLEVASDPSSRANQHWPWATMWNITRLPAPGGNASESSLEAGAVNAHGARRSDRKKIAPESRTRSRTRGTTSKGSRICLLRRRSGVSVKLAGVSVMALPPLID